MFKVYIMVICNRMSPPTYLTNTPFASHTYLSLSLFFFFGKNIFNSTILEKFNYTMQCYQL